MASETTTITSFPLNPLTTTYTPPADCSGFYQPSDGRYMVDPMTSCLPTSAQLSSTAYFSPGLFCPSGYVTACHCTNGVSTITTVICCPVRGEVLLSCVDPVTPSANFATLFCTYNLTPASSISLPITLSSGYGITSTSMVTFSAGGGLNAYGVRMVYESSDLAALSSSTLAGSMLSSTSSSIVASAGGTTGSTPNGNRATTTSAAPALKRTSTATIAVAVVVPVAVLALAGIAYMWWRIQRQREQNRAIHEASGGIQNRNSAINELPSDLTQVKRAELSGDQRHWSELAELPRDSSEVSPQPVPQRSTPAHRDSPSTIRMKLTPEEVQMVLDHREQ